MRAHQQAAGARSLFEPAWCTEALASAEAEHWPETVWSRARRSDIAKVLLNYTHVVESDLISCRGRPQIRRLDFLKTTRKLAPAIVSNPPFKHAAAFIEHAIELGVTYHAWLLKADFLARDSGSI